MRRARCLQHCVCTGPTLARMDSAPVNLEKVSQRVSALLGPRAFAWQVHRPEMTSLVYCSPVPVRCGCMQC